MSKTVSVVTTTYEDLTHLKAVVDGIKKQNYSHIQYIVVDGGSKDGTIRFLQDLETDFAKHAGWELKWISESDHGIYDAINKGVRMATGDIVGVMFDKFATDDVISKMVSVMEREDSDGVHGDLIYVDEQGKPIRKWVMGNTQTIRDGWMPAHQTLYLKREVYEKYGVYKTDYKIAADYEFIVRILQDKSIRLSYIPEVLVHMFYGGTSSGGLTNYIHSFMESYRALKENHVPFAFFICTKRTMKVLWQFVKAACQKKETK
ncbi:MAG: glycosyltransferase [Lachnospiraceae bacterium]|nr:glycosyltransferase [Lachnospiraceae bacterium]